MSQPRFYLSLYSSVTNKQKWFFFSLLHVYLVHVAEPDSSRVVHGGKGLGRRTKPLPLEKQGLPERPVHRRAPPVQPRARLRVLSHVLEL